MRSSDPLPELFEQHGAILRGHPGRGGCRHEGAETGTALNHALVLELPIGAMHRVRVDGDLGHDLSYRGQAVTGVQQAEAHGLADLVDQLTVGR